MVPTGNYQTAVMSREVRDLADFGSGSRLVGERWEQVGGQQIEQLAGTRLRSPAGEYFTCLAVARFDTHAGLLAESSSRGLKSPDCLFAGRDRLDRLVVQPGDFKFTLDVASREQVDPAPIRTLIERGGPRLELVLHGLLLGGEQPAPPSATPASFLVDLLDTGRARLLPGLIFAPDEPSNRQFLRHPSRRSAVGAADVHFLSVDASFFETLPGVEVAASLRRLDGVDDARCDFACLTYYFQLGSAVRGALDLLHRPLLPGIVMLPAIDAVTFVRQQAEERHRPFAIDVARALAAPAAQRRERLRLAQRLAGVGLRGRPTYEVVEAAGFTIGDVAGPTALAKEELRALLNEVDAAHAHDFAARLAGRQRERAFLDDQDVMTWLGQMRPAFDQQARAHLAALLRQRAASGARAQPTGTV